MNRADALERLQRFWNWARTHKVKAALLAFCVFIVFELLTIPWFGVRNLKEENPTETALMRQRSREADSQDKPLKIVHKWIPLSRIPRHVINAVVVAEDGTFWEHEGFDWYEFQQSLKKNWEKKRAARGASTITQQLAKNLYLSTSKDPVRKLKEWLITYLLEHHLEKNRILEIYLNMIEWGRGIFGIEAAARTYFQRSASGLSVEQAIRLAAVIPSPLKHQPTDNSRWVMFRRNVVLQRMQGRRYFEADEEPDEEENAPPENDVDQQEEGSARQTQQTAPPAGTGSQPLDSTRRDAVPSDSSESDRGDTNDVQRR